MILSNNFGDLNLLVSAFSFPYWTSGVIRVGKTGTTGTFFVVLPSVILSIMEINCIFFPVSASLKSISGVFDPIVVDRGQNKKLENM